MTESDPRFEYFKDDPVSFMLQAVFKRVLLTNEVHSGIIFQTLKNSQNPQSVRLATLFVRVLGITSITPGEEWTTSHQKDLVKFLRSNNPAEIEATQYEFTSDDLLALLVFIASAANMPGAIASPDFLAKNSRDNIENSTLVIPINFLLARAGLLAEQSPIDTWGPASQAAYAKLWERTPADLKENFPVYK